MSMASCVASVLRAFFVAVWLLLNALSYSSHALSLPEVTGFQYTDQNVAGPESDSGVLGLPDLGLPDLHDTPDIQSDQKKAAVYTTFRPGQLWADTEGNRIKAHSGGLLTIGKTTYWYGAEGYGGGDRTNKLINVYSSTDLYNWENHGPAFTMNCAEVGDECYADRPKVLHKQGGKYVMWMKSAPWLSVATSTSPLGPFQFVARWHPHNEGETTGDLTAFQDPVTKKGYLIYSAVTADDSRTPNQRLMRIHPMTDDLMNVTEACTTIFERAEAPAVFYHSERYFLWTSGCTGWDSDAATVYASKSLCAPSSEWEDLGNPTGDNVSYSSQSTYILPIPADTNWDFNPPPFIYIADRFEEDGADIVEGPESGRYVWLPIDFTAAGVPTVDWRYQWSIPRKYLDNLMTNGSSQSTLGQ